MSVLESSRRAIRRCVEALDAAGRWLRDRAASLGHAAGPGPVPEAPPAVDARVQARRRELSDSARRHHDALTGGIEALERALEAPAAGRVDAWASRVTGQFDLVDDAIRAHVQDVERGEGLLEEIERSTPRLARRVDALRREHLALAGRASRLAARLSRKEAVEFASVRREAAALLAALREHRAAEADLVYEAFWTDIGAVD